METETKICLKCNKEKPLSEFYLNSSSKDGHFNWCIVCATKYREDHKEEKAKYMKTYAQENEEKISEYQKKYRKEHIEARKKKNKEYREAPAKYDLFYEKIKLYEECQRDPKNSELIQVRCKYCGNWFNPSYSQLDSRIKALIGDKRANNLYCSNACKKACSIFGKQKYPRGLEPATSREVQPELRKMVLERDNWTCQKCGKSKEKFSELELHCHHMFPINEDPICSADMDNCETLCKECHQWKHQNIPGCNYPELKC